MNVNYNIVLEIEESKIYDRNEHLELVEGAKALYGRLENKKKLKGLPNHVAHFRLEFTMPGENDKLDKLFQGQIPKQFNLSLIAGFHPHSQVTFPSLGIYIISHSFDENSLCREVSVMDLIQNIKNILQRNTLYLKKIAILTCGGNIFAKSLCEAINTIIPPMNFNRPIQVCGYDEYLFIIPDDKWPTVKAPTWRFVSESRKGRVYEEIPREQLIPGKKVMKSGWREMLRKDIDRLPGESKRPKHAWTYNKLTGQVEEITLEQWEM